MMFHRNTAFIFLLSFFDLYEFLQLFFENQDTALLYGDIVLKLICAIFCVILLDLVIVEGFC